MEDMYIRAGINILGNVLEKATEYGVYYMTLCNRNTLTSQDIKYGLRYSVRNLENIRDMTTTIEELLEDDEEDDEEEWEDDEDEFQRYEGDDVKCLAMNECYDTWDDWIPVTPAEILLKKSIDKIGNVQASEEDLLLADSE